jgi:hypothetical protein
MKNILFWNLVDASPDGGQMPEILKKDKLKALNSIVQAHAISKTVLLAIPEIRLALEELWMQWKQEDPERDICVEYIAAVDWTCGTLKSSLQSHLPDVKEYRAWCFLKNYQSAHEAFKQALDALSEDINYQVVWIDPAANADKDGDYLLPSLEKEDPYHWSIFEKVKVFETEAAASSQVGAS